MNTRNVKIFSGGVSGYARTLFIGKNTMYIQRKRYVKILYKHLVGFSGCKQTQMNVQKCLEHIIVGRGYIQSQVFGANSPFPTKENFAKNRN